MISLCLKQEFSVPLEAETITPDAMNGRSVSELERLPVLHVNQTARVGDFFSVQGDGRGEPNDTIRVEGNLSARYTGL